MHCLCTWALCCPSFGPWASWKAAFTQTAHFSRWVVSLQLALGTSSHLALKPWHSLLLIDTHTPGYFQRACSKKSLAGSLSRHRYFGVYLFISSFTAFFKTYLCFPWPKHPLLPAQCAAALCPGPLGPPPLPPWGSTGGSALSRLLRWQRKLLSDSLLQSRSLGEHPAPRLCWDSACWEPHKAAATAAADVHLDPAPAHRSGGCHKHTAHRCDVPAPHRSIPACHASDKKHVNS